MRAQQRVRRLEADARHAVGQVVGAREEAQVDEERAQEGEQVEPRRGRFAGRRVVGRLRHPSRENGAAARAACDMPSSPLGPIII